MIPPITLFASLRPLVLAMSHWLRGWIIRLQETVLPVSRAEQVCCLGILRKFSSSKARHKVSVTVAPAASQRLEEGDEETCQLELEIIVPPTVPSLLRLMQPSRCLRPRFSRLKGSSIVQSNDLDEDQGGANSCSFREI